MFKDPFTYDWPDQQKAWQSLLDTPLTPESKSEWMSRWDVLERQYAEQKARLHWDSMADVESPEPFDRFTQFSQNVVPQVMVLQKQVYHTWVAFAEQHPEPGWDVTTRYLKHLQKEQDTIPELLQQEEATMMEHYNTSQLDQPVPAPYASKQDLMDALKAADREERRKAWEHLQEYMVPLRAHRVKTYLDLIQLRWKQAEVLGFANPLELAWERLKRHDFTLAQWQETRTAILEQVPPLLEEVQAQMAEMIGLPELTFMDLKDPTFSEISTAYSRTDLTALHVGIEKLFQAFSPEMAVRYRELLEGGYLDLEARTTKTTQAFADLLPVTNKPCAMLPLDAQASSLTLLLHELGHVFHFGEMLPRHHAMLLEPSYKFMEFVAHTFEVYGAHFADQTVFLTPEKLRALRLLTLFYRLEGLMHCALLDLWEEWVYTTPIENSDQLYDKWEELAREHYPWIMSVPGSGRNYWTTGWQVRVPLGMTRYALADLCTLEFSSQILQDPHQAFERLTEGVRLGGTKPFLELIRACGLHFDFTAASVTAALKNFKPLAEAWGLARTSGPVG